MRLSIHSYVGAAVLCIVFCVTQVHSQTAVLETEWTSGEATYYTNIDYGHCSYFDIPRSSFPYGYIVAVNSDLYDEAVCGACYEVQCVSPKVSCGGCNSDSVTVQVTDECPGCSSDGGLDLSEAAFEVLADKSCGRLNIQFRQVSCDFKNNIVVRNKDGINRWWYALYIDNVANYGDLKNVQVMDSSSGSQGSTWKSPVTTDYNAWVFLSSSGWTTPLSVRLTDQSGAVLIGYDVVTDLTGESEFDFGSNYDIDRSSTGTDGTDGTDGTSGTSGDTDDTDGTSDVGTISFPNVNLQSVSSSDSNYEDSNDSGTSLFSASDAGLSTYVSDNFQVSEFVCADGSDLFRLSPVLVECLQAVREDVASALGIATGYRTVSYNSQVGGATYSRHQSGTAADVFAYSSSVSVLDLAESVICKCRVLFLSEGQEIGLGLGDDFVHVDMRPSYAYWTESSAEMSSNEWASYITETFEECPLYVSALELGVFVNVTQKDLLDTSHGDVDNEEEVDVSESKTKGSLDEGRTWLTVIGICVGLLVVGALVGVSVRQLVKKKRENEVTDQYVQMG